MQLGLVKRRLRMAWPYSLRNRLLIMLPLFTLLPLALIGGSSYSSIHSILENKTRAGALNHLHEVRLSLDNTLSGLNHVSQQLAYDGGAGREVGQYLAGTPSVQKALHDEIVKELSVISFTNPNLGLVFYFSNETGERYFENFRDDRSVQIEKLPLLFRANQMTYFGPHKSLIQFDGNLVFSAVRRVDLPDRDDMYVYMETKYKWAQSLLAGQSKNDQYIHLMVDDKNNIAYSENQTVFPVRTLFPHPDPRIGKINGYYAFEEYSNQSWKVVTLIPENVYNAEIDRWARQFAGISLLSIGVSCLFAALFWRTLYRPLRNLIQDIRNVKNRKLLAPVGNSNNLEFDLIHKEFDGMRTRIVGLIADIEHKERRKTELEVEKLMNQINPHFLHNTLDTIRWMARTEGQYEIDRVISMLNKLLHYNLGKDGETSVQGELEAVKNYVALQEVRYNVHFNVHVRADPSVLDMPIPRFILQPLVENALYHGLEDDGIIDLDITQNESAHLHIVVKDSGRGMDQEQIERLMRGEREEGGDPGMGIGLRYVIRMIRHKYGELADFRIESEYGRFTKITLRIPIPTEGGQGHEKSVGGG